MTYYNDNSAQCCQWLRALIQDGRLPAGRVDDRSIQDVQPSDIGAARAHFFAGIGGWPYALQLAGWPDSWPVWTASCPCQPLSCAGKRGGEKDERHLWPELYRLVSECRPPVIFGEQVASKDGLEWLDGISLDLEELGYAVGSSDLPAACVGAPHIRQRAWWMAYAKCDRGHNGRGVVERCFAASGWAETAQRGGIFREAEGHGNAGGGNERGKVARASEAGFWSEFDLIPCRDGKTRRVEPGTFPLAYGIPNKLGRLRGYGNAIVPQVAAVFIAVVMEILTETNT